jgi:hypothetical protein
MKLFRVALAAFASMGVLTLLGWSGFLAYFILSKPYCSQVAKTEMEAKQALSDFFSGNTVHSRRIIAALREDQITEDSLKRLEAGCSDCFFYKGSERDAFPGLWYAVAQIAPRKTVVILAECSNAVWIEERLYGG